MATTPYQSTATSSTSTPIVGLVILISIFVFALGGIIAIVATIIAIIKCCLKKAKKRANSYAHIEIGNVEKPVLNPASPDFSVVSNPQIEATMKSFFTEFSKEKPIMFSAEELSGFSQNYKTRAGSGGFGIVYKGEFPNGIPVAIKVLEKASDEQAKEQFMAEVSTIGRTYHVNFIRLYGFCFDSTVQALVHEYKDKGSLDGLLFNTSQRIEWAKLHEIAIGTAKGITYLYEECRQRIIHYDIKPENVLLDAELIPKVADFGLAKLSNRDITRVTMTNYRGTLGYVAPELYLPYPVTHKCDVYSFGMLLLEIWRKNHNPNLSEPKDWLPRWTWEMFEKGKLGELLEYFGVEDENKEKAERMSMVALWYVQYLPDLRPLMSDEVKMLEGGTQIKSPPNPFQRLVPATGSLTPSISEFEYSISLSSTLD